METYVGNIETDYTKNRINFEDRARQQEAEDKQKQAQAEEAKKSPYNEFLQLNKKTWKFEDKLLAESPIAYRIFRFLANNMDSYNAVVCSYTVLQEQFEISQVTVARAIKLLKDKGYIAVYKSGTSNVYALNDGIVWNSWGNNLKYSKFPSNVILSYAEQEKTKTIRTKEVKLKNFEK